MFWSDYDESIISESSGVHERTAKSIEISEQLRATLDIVAEELSPVELRHERPRVRPFGYRRADVDHLLESATDAYEVVWRERADLDDRVHELETELARHRETEEAMRSALVSAERAADELARPPRGRPS